MTIQYLYDKLIELSQLMTVTGEVSEWFKEPVLKTGDPERDRGFESHLLRFNWFTCKPWRNTQEAEGAPLERE